MLTIKEVNVLREKLLWSPYVVNLPVKKTEKFYVSCCLNEDKKDYFRRLCNLYNFAMQRKNNDLLVFIKNEISLLNTLSERYFLEKYLYFSNVYDSKHYPVDCDIDFIFNKHLNYFTQEYRIYGMIYEALFGYTKLYTYNKETQLGSFATYITRDVSKLKYAQWSLLFDFFYNSDLYYENNYIVRDYLLNESYFFDFAIFDPFNPREPLFLVRVSNSKSTGNKKEKLYIDSYCKRTNIKFFDLFVDRGGHYHFKKNTDNQSGTGNYVYNILYAYIINDENHSGIIKIGLSNIKTNKTINELNDNCEDLINAACKRIDLQTQTAAIDYDLIYVTVAAYNNTKYSQFIDKTFHGFLKQSGFTPLFFKGVETESFFISFDCFLSALFCFKNKKDYQFQERFKGITATKINFKTDSPENFNLTVFPDKEVKECDYITSFIRFVSNSSKCGG